MSGEQPELSDLLDPQVVQRALVCMLFDPAYAKRVFGQGALPELRERERALLRTVDPRALGTDDMRRARAMAVIVDEFPVSVAAVGVDLVDRFFSSSSFRACVFERGSMVLGFGEFLGNRARGAGAIERAMAQARRGRDAVSASVSSPGALGCPPWIVALEVPAGSLAWAEATRAKLGPTPLERLAKHCKPASPPPPRRGCEPLLVEAKADGSVAVGGASEALVALLKAAGSPVGEAALSQVAVDLGAEAGDVAELIGGLVDDGLLRRL